VEVLEHDLDLGEEAVEDLAHEMSRERDGQAHEDVRGGSLGEERVLVSEREKPRAQPVAGLLEGGGVRRRHRLGFRVPAGGGADGEEGKEEKEGALRHGCGLDAFGFAPAASDVRPRTTSNATHSRSPWAETSATEIFTGKFAGRRRTGPSVTPLRATCSSRRTGISTGRARAETSSSRCAASSSSSRCPV